MGLVGASGRWRAREEGALVGLMQALGRSWESEDQHRGRVVALTHVAMACDRHAGASDITRELGANRKEVKQGQPGSEGVELTTWRGACATGGGRSQIGRGRGSCRRR